MTDKIYSIDEIKQIVTPIAQKYGIKRMYLFGSYARGEATADSDIDFRVDMNQVVGLFKLAEIIIELEEAFNKEIDFITTDSLSPKFLFNIFDEEALMYAS